MKKLLICAMSFFGSMGVFGQSTPDAETSECNNHYIIGLHAGTSGFGLNFKYNFLDHSSVRLGTSMIPFSYSTIQNLGADFKIDAKATYNNIHLLYEYQPFKSVKGIRLVAGAGYFVSAMTNAKLTPDNNITAGITTLTADEIGDLTVKIDSKGFAPYLGLGFGKSIPSKRLNVNFDLGSFYLPTPTATAEGTKLLADNQELANTLTANLSDYRWLPVLQLNINYLIK
jgi:hypothetical protein